VGVFCYGGSGFSLVCLGRVSCVGVVVVVRGWGVGGRGRWYGVVCFRFGCLVVFFLFDSSLGGVGRGFVGGFCGVVGGVSLLGGGGGGVFFCGFCCVFGLSWGVFFWVFWSETGSFRLWLGVFFFCQFFFFFLFIRVSFFFSVVLYFIFVLGRFSFRVRRGCRFFLLFSCVLVSIGGGVVVRIFFCFIVSVGIFRGVGVGGGWLFFFSSFSGWVGVGLSGGFFVYLWVGWGSRVGWGVWVRGVGVSVGFGSLGVCSSRVFWVLFCFVFNFSFFFSFGGCMFGGCVVGGRSRVPLNFSSLFFFGIWWVFFFLFFFFLFCSWGCYVLFRVRVGVVLWGGFVFVVFWGCLLLVVVVFFLGVFCRLVCSLFFFGSFGRSWYFLVFFLFSRSGGVWCSGSGGFVLFFVGWGFRVFVFFFRGGCFVVVCGWFLGGGGGGVLWLGGIGGWLWFFLLFVSWVGLFFFFGFIGGVLLVGGGFRFFVVGRGLWVRFGCLVGGGVGVFLCGGFVWLCFSFLFLFYRGLLVFVVS